MKIKEESLDLYITEAVSGALIYVRTIDLSYYPQLYLRYPELFEPEVVEKPVDTKKNTEEDV